MARVPADAPAAVGVIGAPDATAALRRSLAAASILLREPALPAPGGAAIVTLLPSEPALRAALEACAAAAPRDLAVLDLSPIGPSVQRELAASFEAAGIALFGGCRVARLRDGVPRTTVYVDDDALRAPALRGVLAGLADEVVSAGDAGRAKAIGLLDALLGGVNAAVVAEALTLGVRAGLDTRTLIALLQKGSGATAILAHSDASFAPPARQEALAGVATAALRVDHSLMFGSLAIAASLAQSHVGAMP